MRSTPNGRNAGEEDPAGPLTPPPGAATFVVHTYRVTDPRPLEILSTTWTAGLFYSVCKMSVVLLRYSVLRGQNCIAIQQRYVMRYSK